MIHRQIFSDDELQKKLELDFFNNNQNIHDKITEAITAGDRKLAHRLAHSLKGSAGQIGKTNLQKAAAETETLLKEGIIPVPENVMNDLKLELNKVLNELKPLLDRQKKTTIRLDAGQRQELFDKLEIMFENINPECIYLLDEISSIPGTEKLVFQMENYNFKAASDILADIKMKGIIKNE